MEAISAVSSPQTKAPAPRRTAKRATGRPTARAFRLAPVDQTVTDIDTNTGTVNEHVWYDLPTAHKVATRIADELTTIEPAQAEFFQANLTSFTDTFVVPEPMTSMLFGSGLLAFGFMLHRKRR